METGIAKAIRIAGSQTALGDLFGLTPQAVQKWADQGFVPAGRCRAVEKALGFRVTRYELNPAVFGDDPSSLNKSEQQADDQHVVTQTQGRRKDDMAATPSS